MSARPSAVAAGDHHQIGADLVLSRLDRVRKCGSGYIARCVAHEDRSASLSIGVGHDGRVLLHCFAGCSALDVVHALGLQLADLFPARRDSKDLTPAERSTMRQAAKQAEWAAALNVLDREATLVAVFASMLAKAEPITPDDVDRFRVACQRITDARAVLNAR